MATFVEWLKYFQARAGLSNRELAKEAAYRVRYLEQARAGQRTVTPLLRERLCEALGLAHNERQLLMTASATGAPTPPRRTLASARAAGHLLRTFRLASDLTIERLAHSAGTTPQYLESVETGTRAPGLDLLRRLSRALDLRPHDRDILFTTAAGAMIPAIEPGDPAPVVLDPALPSLVGLRALVGRESLLAELVARFSADAPAPRALLGLPGVGKTTVAAALCHDASLNERYPDGALWGKLGPRPDLAGQRVRWARLLSVPGAEIARDHTPAQWVALLSMAIGARRLLIVLDDAWSAADVQALSVAGPNCATLVTTRIPAVANASAAQGVTIIPELDTDESVRLFWTMAPALAGSENAETHTLEGELVALTGGLPMALALVGRDVARRNRHQPAPAEASLRGAIQRLRGVRERGRITSVLPVLGASASLFSVIAVSEDTLSADEREAFHALAVAPAKPGALSRAAALAISGAPEATLERLVASGLVERLDAETRTPSLPGATPANAATERYTLHQTIRDYALAAGPPAQAAERMVAYYRDYAGRHARDVPALAREQPNLLAALSLAFREHLDVELVALALACAEYFHAHSMGAAIETHLTNAAQTAVRLGDTRAHIAALTFLARNADRQGQGAMADALLDQAMALAHEAEDEAGAIDLYIQWSVFRSRASAYSEASALLLHALSEAERLDLQRQRVRVMRQLSDVSFARGAIDEALAYAQNGLAIARAFKDPTLISGELSSLGNVTSNLGHYREAIGYFHESIAIAGATGDMVRVAYVTTNLCEPLICQGAYTEAESHVMSVQRLLAPHPHDVRLGLSLVHLGRIACARGQDAAAEAHFERAETFLTDTNRPDRLLDLHLYQVELALERNDLERARERLARARGEERALMTPYPEMRAILLLREVELLLREAAQPRDARLDEAERRLQEMLTTANRLGHAEMLCAARCGMGRLERRRGQAALAETWYRAALTPDLEHRPLEAAARFGLAVVYAEQGRTEAVTEARASYTIFAEMRHRRARAVASLLRRLERAPSASEKRNILPRGRKPEG